MTRKGPFLSAHELNHLATAFNWSHRQATPNGPELGQGLEWPAVDDRLMKAKAAGIHWTYLDVLEAAPCEGHVTVGIFQTGAMAVTAFDGRLENVLKTVARCAAWGYTPFVHHLRAERITDFRNYDFLFHFGLLYHLADPVSHLVKLPQVAPQILLDTHTARPNTELVTVRDLEGHWYQEGPETDCLSGLEEKSFWLTRESLADVIDAVGFDCQEIDYNPAHPIGPRSLFYLTRRASR